MEHGQKPHPFLRGLVQEARTRQKAQGWGTRCKRRIASGGEKEKASGSVPAIPGREPELQRKRSRAARKVSGPRRYETRRKTQATRYEQRRLVEPAPGIRRGDDELVCR